MMAGMGHLYELVCIAIIAILPCGCIQSARASYAPFTLYPEPEAVELAERVVNRLTVATGLPWAIGEEGVPVTIVAHARDLSGKELCALTDIWFTDHSQRYVSSLEIQVSSNPKLDCDTQEHTLLHELLHAADPKAAHTAAGIFASEASPPDLIDAAYLELLCNAFDGCPVFKPEL